MSQWNNRFDSHSLLAATVNAARGGGESTRGSIPNDSLHDDGNVSTKRWRSNSGSGRNICISNGSSSGTSSSSGSNSSSSKTGDGCCRSGGGEDCSGGRRPHHPMSSQCAVTPREIVAAALNLGLDRKYASFKAKLYVLTQRQVQGQDNVRANKI